MRDIFEKLSGKEGPFIIADIGGNHGGSIEEAKRLIDKAKEAGVDAVKFQSFTKDSLHSKNTYDSKKDIEFKDFGVKGLDKLHNKILFGDDEYRELKRYCDKIGILFSSAAFAEKEADLLAELNVPFIKIASMELNNLGLLEYIAKKNIPIMISTGMGSSEEIEKAIETIHNAGNNNIVILHCIAMYPVRDYNIINLNKMQMLREKFNLPVGFSDHTLDISVPIAATALGACVIEKHFIINKDDPFARERDFAMDFETMKQLVKDCKRVYCALGNKDAEISDQELEMTKILRRSAVVRRNMNAGELIKEEDVAFKRPGTGIPPTELNTIIGKKLNKGKVANELILREDLM